MSTVYQLLHGIAIDPHVYPSVQ